MRDGVPLHREALNDALAHLLRTDGRTYLVGEDIVDPYGGAFRVTAGLSTEFPDRVWRSPVSEAALLAMANGMALAGLVPIVEVMFGDFVGLAFDQIVNHAAKFARLYGQGVECTLVLRVPVGAGRGYGATHSQCLEKHLLGVPGLAVTAATPHFDPLDVLERLVSRPEPSLFVEHKTLYPERVATEDALRAESWLWRDVEAGGFPARVLSLVPPEECDVVVAAYGGTFARLERVVRELAIDEEILCAAVCVTRLDDPDLGPLWELVSEVGRLATVEEGTAGWGWGAEVAAEAARACWSGLAAPVACVTSRADIIPSGRAREPEVVVTDEQIKHEIRELVAA
jgi:acetoin:2,6-dichlorophenolindophenol oxidoreductase subunit beta